MINDFLETLLLEVPLRHNCHAFEAGIQRFILHFVAPLMESIFPKLIPRPWTMWMEEVIKKKTLEYEHPRL
jgi:hypothetical protein